MVEICAALSNWKSLRLKQWLHNYDPADLVPL